MTTANFKGWSDYAILTPTAPAFNKKGEPVQWKVQINADGNFRCSCPAFIFCKGTKACKHTRRCEQDRLEQGGAQFAGASVTSPVARPVAAPNVIEATRIFDAMCVATVNAGLTHPSRVLGQASVKTMIDVLAQKLAAYVPPTVTRFPTTVAESGIRRITFDD